MSDKQPYGTLYMKLDDGKYKELMPLFEVPTIGSKRITYSQKMWNRYYNDEITAEERDLLIKKHQIKLESKRKYKKGEPIKSLDELMNQEFVYMNHKIYHYGWFASWQGHWLKKCIDNKWLFKAINKEQDNG